MPAALRHLVLVLGDQLDADSAVFDDFDPARDAIWMAEVAQEATQVWSSQPRIALFLSAMRHFRDALRARGWPEPWPTSGLYMSLLGSIPDSHVAHRHGIATAEALRRRAVPLAKALLAAADPAPLADGLMRLDTELKADGLNPGTTADLTVASHLTLALMREP